MNNSIELQWLVKMQSHDTDNKWMIHSGLVKAKGQGQVTEVSPLPGNGNFSIFQNGGHQPNWIYLIIIIEIIKFFSKFWLLAGLRKTNASSYKIKQWSIQPLLSYGDLTDFQNGGCLPNWILKNPISQLWLPSVLWRCWLGGRKGIWPVKTVWWGTCIVICLERDANDLHMVQLTSLPHHHLLLL